MTEAQSTRRKDRPGIPKVAGLTGGAFAAQEHAEADAVALGFATTTVDGQDWATIDTVDDLRDALQQEQELIDSDLNGIDFDENYGTNVHAITERYLEPIATIYERAGALHTSDANPVIAATIGPQLGRRAYEFSKTYRAVQDSEGQWVVKRGVVTTDHGSFSSEAAAIAEAEDAHYVELVEGEFPRVTSAEDAGWAREYDTSVHDTLHAYAAQFEGRNVTEVNLWFGMARMSVLGQSNLDDVVVNDEWRFEHVQDMLKYDRAVVTRLDPDLLKQSPSFEALSEVIANSDEHFGSLMKVATNKDGDIDVVHFEQHGRQLTRFRVH
ncbi:hypothetical protein ACWGJ9_10530 [Curtobacterium citreum]